MRETNIFEYYAFGYDYYLLSHTPAELPVHGLQNTLIARLKMFFEKLDELALEVTKKAADDLVVINKRALKLPKSAKIDAKLASEVRAAIKKLDATLDAELKLRSAYIVMPKRFPLDYLLKNPERIFASKVFTKLPQICNYDFKEACRCIAFGLPTAAAFHAMRGTEGVLRYYYCSIVKRARVDPLLWGNIISHLSQRKDRPSKTLIDHLDNIRINFRNPTQHPEARYDMDEAQDLLAISIDAVNRMVKDIVKRSA